MATASISQSTCFSLAYRNQNFIDDGKNGYLIAVHDKMEKRERIERLAECIVRLFTEADLEAFQKHSYKFYIKDCSGIKRSITIVMITGADHASLIIPVHYTYKTLIQKHSYKKAESYLTETVKNSWKNILK